MALTTLLIDYFHSVAFSVLSLLAVLQLSPKIVLQGRSLSCGDLAQLSRIEGTLNKNFDTLLNICCANFFKTLEIKTLQFTIFKCHVVNILMQLRQHF